MKKQSSLLSFLQNNRSKSRDFVNYGTCLIETLLEDEGAANSTILISSLAKINGKKLDVTPANTVLSKRLEDQFGTHFCERVVVMNKHQKRNFIQDCLCYNVCLKRMNTNFMSVQLRKRRLNMDGRKYKFTTYMNAALPYLRNPPRVYELIKSTKTVQLLYRNTECFAPIKFTMGLTKVEANCVHEICVMQGVIQIHRNPEGCKPIPTELQRKIRKKDLQMFTTTTLTSQNKSSSSITLPTGCDYFISCPRAALFTYRMLTCTTPPTVRPMFPLQNDGDEDEDEDSMDDESEGSSTPSLTSPKESKSSVKPVDTSGPEDLSASAHNDIKQEEKDDRYGMNSSSITSRNQNKRSAPCTCSCQTNEGRSQNSSTAQVLGYVANTWKQIADDALRYVTPVETSGPKDLSASAHINIKQEKEDDSYDMDSSSISSGGQNEGSASYTGICQTDEGRSQNSRITAEALDNVADTLKQVASESLRYVTPVDTSDPKDLSASAHINIKQEKKDDSCDMDSSSISSRGQNEGSVPYTGICQTDKGRSQNSRITAEALDNVADTLKQVASESLRCVTPVATADHKDLSASAHIDTKQEKKDDSCDMDSSNVSSRGQNEGSAPYTGICQTDEGRSQNSRITAETLDNVADTLKQVASESLRCVTPMDTSDHKDLSASVHINIKQEKEDDSYDIDSSSISSRGQNEGSAPYTNICQTDEGRSQNSRTAAEALDSVADTLKQVASESLSCITPVDTSGPEDLSATVHNNIKQVQEDDSYGMTSSSVSSRSQNERSAPCTCSCQANEARSQNSRTTAEALDNVADALKLVANAIHGIPSWLPREH